MTHKIINEIIMQVQKYVNFEERRNFDEEHTNMQTAREGNLLLILPTQEGFMYIETKRLIIRSFKESDAETLYRIKTDGQVLEFIPDFLKRDAKPCEMKEFIREFNRIENEGDTDTWRCYAIENRHTGEVMGCLSFGKSSLLFEYELGWEMIGCYTRKGYASEAASAFSEYFCERYGVDYLIVVMDTDNLASYHTAVKSGFKLFEKRTVYDCSCNRYFDDYYYFRRYYSKCTLAEKYYGDSSYDGRSLKGGEES